MLGGGGVEKNTPPLCIARLPKKAPGDIFPECFLISGVKSNGILTPIYEERTKYYGSNHRHSAESSRSALG